MPHLSSDGSDDGQMIHAAMSPDPFVAACLQIGGNGDPEVSPQSSEYAISNHNGSARADSYGTPSTVATELSARSSALPR